MQQILAMSSVLVLPAALICSWASPAAGASLLRSGSSRGILASLGNASAADTPEELAAARKEIKENWDQMDLFLQHMFVLACKYKHGKDIHGLAADKLSKGEVKGEAGYDSVVKEEQVANLESVGEACGLIVSKHEASCKKGCAKRWGSTTGKFMTNRFSCDKKCDDVYTNFETSCKSKAEALAKVYDVKVKKEAAVEQCHKGYCKPFPSVYIMDDAAAMKTEVTKRCGDQCSDEVVKDKCQKSWLVQADLFRAGFRANCSTETGVKECFDGKKGAISADQTTCATDGKAECGTQKTACETAGETDKTFKSAQEFCDQREKMCNEQVTSKCLAQHEANLTAAQKACEEEAGTTFSTCVDDGMTAKETAEKAACATATKTECDEECANSCQVDKLVACLDELKTDFDVTEHFCTDFWKLLHESSEVDPITGDPIVLLAAKAH
mmetsp:Transcript_79056/g.149107  ORF Transcript_79056/g.149107 Transcript_79056/m.149107 type:complete len:441 (+) Transcript_79056:100-1422(+)